MKPLIGWACVLGFLVIQCFRPERTNPPVNPANTFQYRFHPPENIAGMISRACMDCHSDETRWPWYSSVAPVSWYLSRHVETGRERLNFSSWSQRERGEEAYKLGEMRDWVARGKMPLKSYVKLHPEARLSSSEIDSLVAWIDVQRGFYTDSQ